MCASYLTKVWLGILNTHAPMFSIAGDGESSAPSLKTYKLYNKIQNVLKFRYHWIQSSHNQWVMPVWNRSHIAGAKMQE